MNTKQLISPVLAQQVLMQLSEVDAACFVNRETNNVNRTTTGENGQYFSAGKYALPLNLYHQLETIAPSLEPLQLQEIVVNKYEVGGHIPPHRDVEGFAAFAVLALADDVGTFVYHDEGGSHEIKDKAGQVIICNTMTLLHELLPTNSERFSVIFLYL